MRKITTISVIFAGAAALCACQTAQQAATEDTVWVRMDKQKMADHPELVRQFENDRTICKGEVAKAKASMGVIYSQGLYGALQTAAIQQENQKTLDDVATGCMAERGYVLVPKSALPKA